MTPTMPAMRSRSARVHRPVAMVVVVVTQILWPAAPDGTRISNMRVGPHPQSRGIRCADAAGRRCSLRPGKGTQFALGHQAVIDEHAFERGEPVVVVLPAALIGRGGGLPGAD